MALVWGGETELEPAWQLLNLYTARSLPEPAKRFNGKSTKTNVSRTHEPNIKHTKWPVERTETLPHHSLCSSFCSPVWCFRASQTLSSPCNSSGATCCLVNWVSAVRSQVNWLTGFLRYGHGYTTRRIWNLSLVRMQGTKVFLMFTG